MPCRWTRDQWTLRSWVLIPLRIVWEKGILYERPKYKLKRFQRPKDPFLACTLLPSLTFYRRSYETISLTLPYHFKVTRAILLNVLAANVRIKVAKILGLLKSKNWYCELLCLFGEKTGILFILISGHTTHKGPGADVINKILW